MKFDKETAVVIAIALAVLVGWGIYYPRYQKEEVNKAKQHQELLEKAQADAEKFQKETSAVQKKSEPVKAEAKKSVSTPEKSSSGNVVLYPMISLSNKLADFQINPNTGTIDQITFKEFENSLKKEKVVLNSIQAPFRTFALGGNLSMPLVQVEKPQTAPGTVTTSRVVQYGDARLKVTQTFTLPEKSYTLKSTMSIRNLSGEQVMIPELYLWTAGLPPLKNLSGDALYNDPRNIEFCPVTTKKMGSVDPEAKEEKFKNAESPLPMEWVGNSNKYFASLLFPSKPFDGGFKLSRAPIPNEFGKPGELYQLASIAGVYKNISLPAGASLDLSFNCFIGPKYLKEINKLPESAVSVLHLSYFSWMDMLARPLVWLLNYLKDLCGSYGIAIILLTLIVRIVFWPITERANRSMRKMQKLQPLVKDLREKYKERPQEMNAKMMELYRAQGVNPLGGCLPILLQLPVFFALYSALDSAVELRHVSFLWATDLTKPDLVGPQFLFGYGIHPLILIMTALMVIQQKMTPSTMDPIQQKMMMAMPLIMLVMLYNLPSGLTLYWTVSQIFSILQMKYSQYTAKREEEKEALKSKSS